MRHIDGASRRSLVALLVTGKATKTKLANNTESRYIAFSLHHARHSAVPCSRPPLPFPLPSQHFAGSVVAIPPLPSPPHSSLHPFLPPARLCLLPVLRRQPWAVSSPPGAASNEGVPPPASAESVARMMREAGARWKTLNDALAQKEAALEASAAHTVRTSLARLSQLPSLLIQLPSEQRALILRTISPVLCGTTPKEFPTKCCSNNLIYNVE